MSRPFFDGVLWSTKVFNFDKMQLTHFSLVAHDLVSSKDALLKSRPWRFTFIFSKSCIVFALTFRASTQPFWVNFFFFMRYAARKVQFHSFAGSCAVVLAPLLRRLFFPDGVVLALFLNFSWQQTVGLVLDPRFYSAELRVCLGRGTTLSGLSLLCSKFWTWEVRVLLLCYFLGTGIVLGENYLMKHAWKECSGFQRRQRDCLGGMR